MKFVSSAALLMAAAQFGAAPALAAPPTKIARVRLVMAEDDWQVREGFIFSPRIDQGVHGTIQGESRILVRNDAQGEPLAVLAVAATWGRAHVESWMECKGTGKAYVRSLAKGRFDTAACVQFGGPYDSEGSIGAGFGRFNDARAVSPLAVPPVAYAVSIHMSTDNGSMITIEGLIATSFVGLPDRTPIAELPPGFAAPLAGWADAAAEATLASLRSPSGELTMPALEFRPRVLKRAVAFLH